MSGFIINDGDFVVKSRRSPWEVKGFAGSIRPSHLCGSIPSVMADGHFIIPD